MNEDWVPRDATGRAIDVGDRVRVLAVPSLAGMSPDAAEESRVAFEHVVGRYVRVRGFDDRGFVEVAFRVRAGPLAGLHSLWIEPGLLRVRRSRSTD